MSCCCEHRCGGHFNLKKTLLQTLQDDPDCPCKQIFLGGPTTYKCRNLSDDDKKATKQFCEKHNKTFYVHAPYIANLAKEDNYKAYNVICEELIQIKDLPSSIVLHIGKAGKVEDNGSLENVSSSVNDMITQGYLENSYNCRTPFYLLFEVAAGQGTELGKNWEELRHLFEGVDKSKCGLCIDTQHFYASGMCEFQTHEDIVNLFDYAEECAPKGISMIHLNDSKKPFGSRVDRHEIVGEGYIWKNNKEGLKSLIDICYEKGIDLISETNDPEKDMVTVKALLDPDLQ